jgi:hypothetical protein
MSNLDARLRSRVRTEISRLHNRLGTTMYITRDQVERSHWQTASPWCAEARTQLIVNLDADSIVTEGEDAALWLDPTRIHLFDPVTGANLTHRHPRARPGSWPPQRDDWPTDRV